MCVNSGYWGKWKSIWDGGNGQNYEQGTSRWVKGEGRQEEWLGSTGNKEYRVSKGGIKLGTLASPPFSPPIYTSKPTGDPLTPGAV